MLTHLWEHLYDIISNNLHMFNIPVNTFLKSSTVDFKKDFKISMRVSLLEKQNWYYRDHLEKISMMFWQE